MSKGAQKFWLGVHKVSENAPINRSNYALTKGNTNSMLELGAKTVLEVGCGRICRANHPSIYYVGVDFCRLPLEELHSRDGVECIVADARHLPFKDEAFDCVITITVVQHVGEKQVTQNDERKKAQREIVRVSGKYTFQVEAHWGELIEISKPEFKPKTINEGLAFILLERIV